MNFKQHERRKEKQEKQSKAHKNHNPSEESSVYWIYARREIGHYPINTEQSGKWLIFTSVDMIDEKWHIIKAATEKGRLGNTCKVSTVKPSPIAKDPNIKVICVYTYNWQDKEDVMRIRSELTNLGFTDALSYKTDEDTRNGKYSWKGDHISKYRV